VNKCVRLRGSGQSSRAWEDVHDDGEADDGGEDRCEGDERWPMNERSIDAMEVVLSEAFEATVDLDESLK
jgi:hypothetical protein